MAIEQQSRYEPAKVLYFDSRRGTGHCITRAGSKCRITSAAVSEANVTALDPDDEIFVRLDEHDRTRVEALHLPEPVAGPEPTPMPAKTVFRKPNSRKR